MYELENILLEIVNDLDGNDQFMEHTLDTLAEYDDETIARFIQYLEGAKRFGDPMAQPFLVRLYSLVHDIAQTAQIVLGEGDEEDGI